MYLKVNSILLFQHFRQLITICEWYFNLDIWINQNLGINQNLLVSILYYGDLHSKECMTWQRPSHRVWEWVADWLSLRRLLKHTAGPSGQMYEGAHGCFPGLQQIRYGVPNGGTILTYLILLVLNLISIVCYWMPKYMEWVLGCWITAYEGIYIYIYIYIYIFFF